MSTLQRLTDADVIFIASTVSPENAAGAAVRLRADEAWLDRMLDDDRVAHRLRDDTQAIAWVSPWLLFSVLLRSVRRELCGTSYTVEQFGGERIAVFDARRAGELLADPRVADYLVELLASFTRISSFTVAVEEEGRVHRRRFSDVSSEDMLALAALVPDELRFPFLRRIADIALFTTGVFPESVLPWHAPPGRRSAHTGLPATVPWSARRTLEDYEEEGRRFYRLASEHVMAKRAGMAELLATLADAFPLARKPLSFMASQYIGTSRMMIFGSS
ncbi:MAG TPA: hypothetical protein VGK88_05945 [bacterium]|jgi:hypothetical protein